MTVRGPQWLSWARRLQAIAQAGLTYGNDRFDLERYREVRAIAAEMTAAHTHLTSEQITLFFDAQTGYPTPKVGVRAAVFDGRRILLVKEKSDNLWTLPGGFADADESPAEATARECLEESGYQVKPMRLLALYDDRFGEQRGFTRIYRLFFDCEVFGRVDEIDEREISECGFFSIDALPPLSMARCTANEIGRLWELHEHWESPTDFD